MNIKTEMNKNNEYRN